MSTHWLDIDMKGFAQTLTDKGVARVAIEAVSNALDTNGANIVVNFDQSNGWAHLDVTDDDPEGFKDLRDAYTLYAASTRRTDVTKRGRYGQGEKELLALCYRGGSVYIQSTTGTILFTQEGRSRKSAKTEAGTHLHADFRCNKDEAQEFRFLLRRLIIPQGVNLKVDIFHDGNPGTLITRKTITTTRSSLQTVIWNEDNEHFVKAARTTTVELVEPLQGEQAYIYELGVPVVDYDGPVHVNVMQKVPLNRDRDNVPPAYLRELHRLTLEALHEDLTSVEAKQGWVADALRVASPEATKSVVHTIHGKDAVIFDPSNPEATKIAAERGRTVIKGRQFSADVWNRIRKFEIVKPAGQVIQTTVRSSPGGKPPIPESEWTPAMVSVAAYTRDLGRFLIGGPVVVQFHNVTTDTARGHAVAWYGGGVINFNLRYLGKKWPETASQEDIDALILHEFAHHFASDHYSSDFYESICCLGAKLRNYTRRIRT